MTDRALLLGVDTGGTYTDAAVIDASCRTVLATAKALTTRGDLAVGVEEAIRAAVGRLAGAVPPSAIGLVSISTTLATNAVVEGHGGPVAVLLVGFDATMAARTGISGAFPGMPVDLVAGGHDHAGAERMPLDEAAVAAAAERHAGAVEAFAVAAQFAVRNPAHERRVREILVGRTGLPVTISSELSSDLDAPRRALTATLNARLISRVSRLIAAVGRAMGEIGIDAPLMIVKGDGTLALAASVATRPIETVLSGPAASLVGARFLTRLDDFILADMGGTTTDLAVFEAGRARVTDAGADLGGWRTMVRAVDVRAVGLGGDSEVTFGPRGEISIGPARVLPLSLAGARFPSVLAALERELVHPTVSSQSGRFVLRPLGWTAAGGEPELPRREAEMLARIGEAPVPLASLASGPSSHRAIEALRAKGLVQVAGLAPSDAAHVLGLQDNWSREAADLGLGLAVRLTQMRRPDPERGRGLAEAIREETVRRAGIEVLGLALGPAASGPIAAAVARGETQLGLARIQVSPTLPLVAVGGPANVYFGEVGRRLGAEVVTPAGFEAANAIGAATAVVARKVTVPVTSDGNGLFRVHAPDGVLTASRGGEALALAEAAARRAAAAAAAETGAADAEIRVEIGRRLLPGSADDDGLFDATVTAEAIGRPALG